MKKTVLLFTYCGFLSVSLFLFSCQKELIKPNGAANAKMDSTIVDDSSGGFDFDFLPHGNSDVWDDSTGVTNPNDSTGGVVIPLDSIGFGFTPHGNSDVWNDSIGGTNPNDTLGGGN